MNLILDTHVLLWMISNSERLSDNARELICDNKNTLHLSAASYWEVCIKISIGKLDMGREWKHLINRHIALNEIQWLPIRKNHAQGICTLPGIHKDPFDRIIISQAKCEKMTVATADKYIQQYPINWAW